MTTKETRDCMSFYFVGIIAALILFFVLSVAPIDRVPKEYIEQCKVMEEQQDDMMFELKSLSLERYRLEHELSQCQVSTDYEIGDAFTTTTPELPYYVPADIQEPLPYIEE